MRKIAESVDDLKEGQLVAVRYRDESWSEAPVGARGSGYGPEEYWNFGYDVIVILDGASEDVQSGEIRFAKSLDDLQIGQTVAVQQKGQWLRPYRLNIVPSDPEWFPSKDSVVILSDPEPDPVVVPWFVASAIITSLRLVDGSPTRDVEKNAVDLLISAARTFDNVVRGQS